MNLESAAVFAPCKRAPGRTADFDAQPLRVLQVVGGMQRAGTETWLMNVLRKLDPRQYTFDFLVHSEQEFDYSRELRSHGANLRVCLAPHRPWEYARNFRRLIAQHGPYHVVHAHLQQFNGIVMRLAASAGVPVRIAHSHTDQRPGERAADFLRRCYGRISRRWISHYATAGLACSPTAAEALFGSDWQADSRWQVQACGIDLSAFRQPVDRTVVRRELGIPNSAFVVGHVGRFVPVKNHLFSLAVTAALVRRRPNAMLLLVGDGPLRIEVERRAAAAGLAANVRVVGARNDVPRLLKSMDAFLFPSLFEGLGLALVEAQAAGLGSVCSTGVPPQAVLLPELVRRSSLEASPEAWASDLLEVAAQAADIPANISLERVETSEFNIHQSVAKLFQTYRAGTCTRSAA